MGPFMDDNTTAISALAGGRGADLPLVHSVANSDTGERVTPVLDVLSRDGLAVHADGVDCLGPTSREPRWT